MSQSADIQAEYVKKAYELVNSSGTGASVLGLCPALNALIPATGLLLTNLADQNNPISVGNIQVADGAVGPNGTGVTWTTPNFVDLSVSVMANSVDDIQLSIALASCRKMAGLTSLGQPPAIWSLSTIYPNALAQSRIYTNCILMNGEPGSVLGTNGRINCKTFTWRCYGFGMSEGTGGFSIG